ncbi:hypothetical protein ACIQNI_22710 [Streptomyces sp. NPDC091266]|uniref:hypothetical protein n=1 Tax=Streptomyces sp. NPDC091266 TaxID=3365978 RepID=UPI0037FAC62A
MAPAKCLGAGLIDEVLLHVAPVLLFGEGIRLFDRPGAPIELEPTTVPRSGKVTNLRFSTRTASQGR